MSVLPSRDFNNFPKALIYNFCAVAYSLLGYMHTAETKALMSERKSGNTYCVGRILSSETIDLIRLNQPNRMSIFVYDLNNKLVGEFLSQNAAAKFLNVSATTVRRYLASGKVLQGKFILRLSSSPPRLSFVLCLY